MNNFTLNSGRTNPGIQPPPTPLANSLTLGKASEIRAGTDLVCRANPIPVFSAVNGFDYLLDLVPDTSAGRLVELQSDAPFSAQTTLVMSYRATDQGEQANSLIGEGGYQSTDLRDFRVVLKFGTGNAAHDVECDIAEGGVITLPASNVDATLYSTHWTRWGGPYGTQNPLRTQAHLASWAGPTSATCTDRVNAPYQAALDLLDPPTIEQWMADLWEAICEEQYLLVVGAPV